MPIDDYASAGGGALRLKGAKVTKKKKRKDKSGLEKALSGGDGALVKADRDGEGEKKRKKSGDEQDGEEREEDRPLVKKTEAEKRIDELKRKRVGLPPGVPVCGDGRWVTNPTQFLEMAEDPEARPELLKTHKDRVEELNSFLSKLSEHNDMPKIGPG